MMKIPISTSYNTKALILQATSFCNIHCKYCYLPDIDQRNFMSKETLKATIDNIIYSELLGDSLDIHWHVGEPLIATLDYYQQSLSYIDQRLSNEHAVKIRTYIQTNLLPLNKEHCQLFKKYDVHVGVSLDGLDFLHDKNRVSRSGQPTHKKVLENIKKLQDYNIPFSVICVLTKESLSYPQEIYKFFENLGVKKVGFNIDEIEGDNKKSSFNKGSDIDAYKDFIRTLYRMHRNRKMYEIREFDQIEFLIAKKNIIKENLLTTPLATISIDTRGNFSTFSPELLSMKTAHYADFHFGNVHEDLIVNALASNKFKEIMSDIATGTQWCEQHCEHFFHCLGGCPSNRYFENSTFKKPETLHCMLTKQAQSTAILAELKSILLHG